VVFGLTCDFWAKTDNSKNKGNVFSRFALLASLLPFDYVRQSGRPLYQEATAKQPLGGWWIVNIPPIAECAMDGAPVWLCWGEGAKTKADPPFDFAQGRLFGDDN
jgi:hypothetical protein